MMEIQCDECGKFYPANKDLCPFCTLAAKIPCNQPEKELLLVKPPATKNTSPCPDCGQFVSKRAAACPACGAPITEGALGGTAGVPLTTIQETSRAIP